MPAQSGTHREFHPFSLGLSALASENRVDQRVSDRCNRGGTTPRRPEKNTDGRVNRHNPARPTPRAVTPRAGV